MSHSHCAVKGCIGRKRKKKYHAFTVPRRPNLITKWSESLQQALTPRSRVCDFHFNESDIVLVDRVVLSDGNIFESKRLKPKLKPNAIPTFNPHENVALSSEYLSDNNTELDYVVYIVDSGTSIETANSKPKIKDENDDFAETNRDSKDEESTLNKNNVEMFSDNFGGTNITDSNFDNKIPQLYDKDPFPYVSPTPHDVVDEDSWNGSEINVNVTSPAEYFIENSAIDYLVSEVKDAESGIEYERNFILIVNDDSSESIRDSKNEKPVDTLNQDIKMFSKCLTVKNNTKSISDNLIPKLSDDDLIINCDTPPPSYISSYNHHDENPTPFSVDEQTSNENESNANEAKTLEQFIEHSNVPLKTGDNKICRTCLSSNNLFPIFYTIVHVLGSKAKLADVLMECTSVNVSKKDGLPQKMCSSCIDKINQWLFFKDKCLKIDKQLRTDLSSSQKIIPFKSPLQDCVIIDEVAATKNPEDIVVTDKKIANNSFIDLTGSKKPAKRIFYKKIINPQEGTNDTGESQEYIQVSTVKTKSINNNSNITEPFNKNNEITEPFNKNREITESFNKNSDITEPLNKNSDNIEPISLNSEIIDNFRQKVRDIVNKVQKSQPQKKKIQAIGRPCEICGELVADILRRSHRMDHLRKQKAERRTEERRKAREEKKKLRQQQLKILSTCTICDKIFAKPASLKIHMQNSHLRTKNVDRQQSSLCTVCGKLYENYSALRIHMRTHIGDYKCSQCDKKFVNSSRLMLHMQKHPETGLRKQNVFPCDLCDRQFKRKVGLRCHKVRCHNEEPGYLCPVCGKGFGGPTPCCNRKIRQKRIIVGKYQCSFCGKNLNSNGTLEVHLRVHTGERPYQCHICGKGFTQAQHVTRHLSSHEEGGISYRCKYCNKNYSQKAYLVGHLRTHTGEKPFECTVCSEKFHLKALLKRHLRRHTNEHRERTSSYARRRRTQPEKLLECQYCNKKFASQIYLSAHLNHHTGEKPYECKVCSETFHASWTRANHMKKMHNPNGHYEKKRHMCSYCDKGYLSTTNLQTHIRTHTGEQPYECIVCSKKFRGSALLWQHMKTHRRRFVDVQ